MAFTTLERDIFRISGTAIGPGQIIAAGTALESVRLTTIDEDAGPLGPLGLNFDPFNVNRGELVSLRIDGISVAETVPSFSAVQIVTAEGTFTARAFTAGGNTYIVPRAEFPATADTVTTASATIATSAAGGLAVGEFGLRPENANTYSGSYYTENFFGSTRFGTGTAALDVFDADGIRGTADSVGEELALSGIRPIGLDSAQEIVASVEFADGTAIAGVRGLLATLSGSYGEFTRNFLFDSDALAAVGKTLADITGVQSFATTDHSLNWEDLGLTLTAQGDGGPFTPDPEPFVFNEVTGTGRADSLLGSDGRDLIRGLGRSDTMDGGADADSFVFGNETRDGRRDTDRIVNYEAGVDRIYFDDSAVVRDVRDIAGGVRIIFDGDGDRVDVLGEGVTRFTVGIFSADFLGL